MSVLNQEDQFGPNFINENQYYMPGPPGSDFPIQVPPQPHYMPNYPDQYGNNKNNFNQGPPNNFYPPPPYNMGGPPMIQIGPNQFAPSME